MVQRLLLSLFRGLKRVHTLILGLLLLCLVFVSCLNQRDIGPLAPEVKEKEEKPPEEEKVSLGSFEKAINIQGGSVTYRGASINVPRDVVKGSTFFGVVPMEEYPKGPLEDTVYKLIPANHRFSIPLTIKIRYLRESVPEDLEEKDLTLALLNGQRWMELADVSLDLDARELTAKTDMLRPIGVVPRDLYQTAYYRSLSEEVSEVEKGIIGEEQVEKREEIRKKDEEKREIVPVENVWWIPGSAGKEAAIDLSTSFIRGGSVGQISWDLDGDGEYDDETGKAQIRVPVEPGSKRSIGYRIRQRENDLNEQTGSIEIDPSVPVPFETDTVFSISKPVAQLKEEVEFQALAVVGKDTRWSWDFGDGTSGRGQKAKHAYSAAGTYPVTLTIERPLSDRNLYSVTGRRLVVVKGDKPNLLERADPRIVVTYPKSSDMQAVNLRSTVEAGSDLQFLWDTGDGNTGEGSEVSHRYEEPGTYLVRLTIKMPSGEKATAERIVYAFGESMMGTGILLITKEHQSDILGDRYRFSVEPTGLREPIGYLWDFGDGTISSVPEPIHVFPKDGKYLVTLTLKGSDGETRKAYDIVVRGEAKLLEPKVNITASALMGPAPLSSEFSALVSEKVEPLTHVWTFGDGKGYATGQTISHTFDTAGIYKVTVRVFDGAGRELRHSLLIQTL